jgi:hypothetical protein
MMEQVMRPSVAGFMYFSPIIANFTEAKTNGNYYAMGLSFSQLWRYFFDGSLTN